MTQYRVKVRAEGILRVEADSPEEAERMAEEAPVAFAGNPLFGEERAAEVRGEVERHSLQPEDQVQRMDVETGG